MTSNWSLSRLLHGEIVVAMVSDVSVRFGSSRDRIISYTGKVFVTNYKLAFYCTDSMEVSQESWECSFIEGTDLDDQAYESDYDECIDGHGQQPQRLNEIASESSNDTDKSIGGVGIAVAKLSKFSSLKKLKSKASGGKEPSVNTAAIAWSELGLHVPHTCSTSSEMHSSLSRGFEFPLGLIANVDKVGGRRSDHFGIKLSLKDFCKVFLDFDKCRYTLTNGLPPRRVLFDALFVNAFPLTHNRQLFAELHGPDEPPPSRRRCGWDLYDPVKEWARVGVPNSSWQLCHENDRYSLCATYPRLFVVPAAASLDVITGSAAFRTKNRLPVVSWLHPRTGAAICRSAQPKVGMLGHRSSVDEELLRLISTAPPQGSGKMLIIDARPYKNAVGNQLMGAGFESSENYSNAEVLFMGVENIHVVRDSLKRLLSGASACDWLQHISSILVGAMRVATAVEDGISVLCHCSDGWDRTPQLVSLATIILDPYYRTLHGFLILLECDWLSFGHKFHQRLGHGIHRPDDEQRSPIFLQFLDCVWQIMSQFPTEFDFSSRMLSLIANEMYSVRFGTFLFNSEYERVDARISERTRSLWAHIELHRDTMELNNPDFQPAVASLAIETHTKSLGIWGDCYYRVHGSDICRRSLHPTGIEEKVIDITKKEPIRIISNDFEGYLLKRGSINKGWKKRWFVLESDAQLLHYFKSHDDGDLQTPLGSIELRGAAGVEAGRWNKGDKDHVFKLDTPGGRTFYLKGQDDDEVAAWTHFLTMAVNGDYKEFNN